MATYIILNLVFIAVAVTLLMNLKALYWDRISTRVLVLLLALTMIFDSLLIATSVIAYDSSKMLGIYLGYAPIEDFMYTILAVIIIPSVWKKLGTRSAS